MAKSLELDDRMQKYQETDSFFLLLKDNKDGWPSKISRRLVNGAKTEIGVISKHILQNIIDQVKEKTKSNSWQSTDEALEWYKGLDKNENLSFLTYDIEGFYPAITEELF